MDFTYTGALERLEHAPVHGAEPGHALPDLVQARSDVEAAAIWLEATTHNPKSRRVMRKEVERFILWARHLRGKRLSQIGVMDVRVRELHG